MAFWTQEEKEYYIKKRDGILADPIDLDELNTFVERIKNEFYPIPNFSHYRISKLGEVYSHHYGIILQHRFDRYGYKKVFMRNDDGKQVECRIHRLLAIVFIPNPNNYPLVCHRNDIKTDNRIENLYWGTYADNTRDRFINAKKRNL